MTTTALTMFMMQGLLTVLIGIVLYLLKRMDTKMDTYQSKEACLMHREYHDRAHCSDKEIIRKEYENLKQDITTGLNSVRRGNYQNE